MSREIIVDTLSVLSGRFSVGPSALGLPMLLAASCLFYMAFVPAYIGILAITILIDYVAGIRIEAATGTRRRLWLVLSIASTCAVLFVFKYFDFFNDTIALAARAMGMDYAIPGGTPTC